MRNNKMQSGFIFPLTVIISMILLAFVFHALLLLNSEREFVQSAWTAFQLQQIRENALADFEEQIKSDALPVSGSLLYESGTVTYSALEEDDRLEITFTVIADRHSETNRIIYQLPDGRPIEWYERISP